MPFGRWGNILRVPIVSSPIDHRDRLPPMFFLPSFHQGSICGNSIDPRKEAGPFLESVDFGPYRYVGVLKDLFGIC